MIEDKLYVLVRRDLPWSVRIVQSIHAASQLVIQQKDVLAPAWGKYGPSVVLLGVKNEAELKQWRNNLGKQATPFYEPDLDDELTSVAYFGNSDVLVNLNLL